MEKRLTLLRIENDRELTKEADPEFFHVLQRGLLLALKEEGSLNEMQFRNAESGLLSQNRNRRVK